MNLKNAKTYVYIDVSNIRYACSWSLGFQLDFAKLYAYLKKKYPGLQDVRYYEGIAKSDKKKRDHMKFLKEKVGYTICPLERKSYVADARYKNFRCLKCGFLNKVKILPKVTKMKSNVDVYLASDMVECAARAKEPINIVLLSCDGDYVEAIKACLRLSPESLITVLAVPMKKVRNYLSKRLRDLRNELSHDNYRLNNIEEVKQLVSLGEHNLQKLSHPPSSGGPS